MRIITDLVRAALSLAILLAVVPAVEARPPLLSFRDGHGGQQPVKTPADWAIRRRQILQGMEAAMGPLPDRAKLPPLDVQIGDRYEGDGFTRFKLSYASDEGDRVPAYLFLPQGRPGRRPAVLALHQTTPLGKDEPAGLGGAANLHYGLELARRGYVVLVPDYPSLGEYAFDFGKSKYASGSMKGIVNHIRGVDLLCGRKEVDPQRIGVIGHSLGGHNAMFLAAFDTRIKAAVASCGWTMLADYHGGKLDGWAGERYMPRLQTVYGLDPAQRPSISTRSWRRSLRERCFQIRRCGTTISRWRAFARQSPRPARSLTCWAPPTGLCSAIRTRPTTSRRRCGKKPMRFSTTLLA